MAVQSIQRFQKLKAENKKICFITCYDFTSAKIISGSNIDSILVGDSAAMVCHGYSTTIQATTEMMAVHVAAVRRGAPDYFITADMPFLAHRKGLKETMATVDRLMKSGASAVKIEGAKGHLDIISHIIESGVPVMGHLGLTPQSVHQFGGHKLQGNKKETAEQILMDAHSLQSAGVFSLVLEMVPGSLAKKITNELHIPTIGIGAGPHTSGQILVWQDLLGMDDEFSPKFLRKYLQGQTLITDALNQYCDNVRRKHFPGKEESF
ncbi:MAG TPA: 3-methyl-2-oxobutanoate hydroxymethyltransferase [Candidatus Marinimicrobia bacterium]|jgi:3-methyl-2-oxobutanoate hydroxymethyltransferase|nr:3-methyl-2-oxobutanoate hydroxymethyltransferase [Candidatus Neomarinimicrobiota bacterium]MEE1506651.1 3-methyl-2-oxobutanoate hydroxymethyltransferase [Candidatus Neomarinimicrobiota bacterium]MEE1572801.1 3-methyl-2-oxobutanoate hydroxymethyltransferase [Candidatus Neomarinimicrobiota bacterium]HJL79069.1 3-methyl-2-oxobutanoate hydroxymethyltransferase [Candidatus Neomarinimicrobiota bacterium]HJN68403.1 3-methyl-2-oxobutanoate hydroxymethyltransferase [Candidatus Neomarinimicrobiota bac|tara:strand:- start:6656 stop:7450 length:795 start_codon:yes stop_codon:yes gene_type:complete